MAKSRIGEENPSKVLKRRWLLRIAKVMRWIARQRKNKLKCNGVAKKVEEKEKHRKAKKPERYI